MGVSTMGYSRDYLNQRRNLECPALHVRRCHWVAAPAQTGYETGWSTISIDRDLGFVVRRAFWLTDVPPGKSRGNHAHRESILATFAIRGRCLLQLDDGIVKETVPLEGPTCGLAVGRWIWHDLTDFAPGTVVLVLASTLYDEAEYVRDYEVFRNDVTAINEDESRNHV
jgi:hypothetical protein